MLVTILLAGIIFLAMVPLFVSGLKTTSTNTRRIIATNLAQARIESMRMLNWNDITQANLNSNTFADGQFATTYTPPRGRQPIHDHHLCQPLRFAQPDAELQGRHCDSRQPERQLHNDRDHGHHEPRGRRHIDSLGPHGRGNGPY